MDFTTNQQSLIRLLDVREHAVFMAIDREDLRQKFTIGREALRQKMPILGSILGESGRKHLAATEPMQQMFGEVQNINQRLSS